MLPKDKKRLQASVTKTEWAEIDRFCQALGITKSQLTTTAIHEWMDRNRELVADANEEQRKSA